MTLKKNLKPGSVIPHLVSGNRDNGVDYFPQKYFPDKFSVSGKSPCSDEHYRLEGLMSRQTGIISPYSVENVKSDLDRVFLEPVHRSEIQTGQ